METFSRYTLTEKMQKGKPVVSVDFQPDFSDDNTDAVAARAMEFLNNQTGKILVIYNGEAKYEKTQVDQGNDLRQVLSYMEEMGFDIQKENAEYVNKQYGFFRSWIDTANTKYSKLTLNEIKRAIKKVVNIMFLRHESDSRDVWDIAAPELEKEGLLEDWMSTDPIWLSPDLNLAKLREYNNCYLIGGGRHECLEEISILFNCINVKYTIIQDLVYG